MNEHAVSGLSLAAVACYRIAVVEVRIFSDVERNGAACVEADSQIAAWVDFLDCAKLAVGDVLLSIRRGKLYAVALREAALCLAVECHALQTARIVTELLAVLSFDGEQIAENVASQPARCSIVRTFWPCSFMYSRAALCRTSCSPVTGCWPSERRWK